MTKLNTEIREEFVTSQIVNVHDSQKWIWSILAGFALYEATKNLIDDIVKKVTCEPVGVWDICDPLWLHETPLVYLVFLSILFRFYIGDSRILDYFYKSVPEALSGGDFDTYVCKMSSATFIIDAGARVIQFLMIAAISLLVLEPLHFVIWAYLLLALNAIISYVILEKTSTDGGQTMTGLACLTGHAIPFSRYRKVWFWNNTGTFVLASVLYFSGHLSITGALAMLLVNSLIDVGLCREVYFPQIGKFYPKKNETGEGIPRFEVKLKKNEYGEMGADEQQQAIQDLHKLYATWVNTVFEAPCLQNSEKIKKIQDALQDIKGVTGEDFAELPNEGGAQ